MSYVKKRIEALQCVGMRHIGPYYKISETWEKFCAWAGPKGLFRPGCAFGGAYHDHPEETPEEELRSDVFVTVESDPAFDEPGISCFRLKAGEYASRIHQGPYDGLKDAWGKFVGDVASDPEAQPAKASCLEFCLNDPSETPPDQLLTEMLIPLKLDD